jgi:hypothetical protein
LKATRAPVRLATAAVEQALFGAGSFAVTWFAGRHFTTSEFAEFSLVWIWIWSLGAVANEGFVVPLSYEAAARRLDAVELATANRLIVCVAAPLALAACVVGFRCQAPSALDGSHRPVPVRSVRYGGPAIPLHA